MAIFHQIGHDSENLLREADLSRFAGAILSPVNFDESESAAQIQLLKDMGKRAIFDPQLYYPRSERGCLREWSHYPTDVDTADVTSEGWWHAVVDSVSDVAIRLLPHAVCTPAFCPNAFSNEYYQQMVNLANRLTVKLAGTQITPLLSLVVRLPDLAQVGRAEEIASLATRSRTDHVLLVLMNDVQPRRELSDPDQLTGALRLIAALSSSGVDVTVAFASTDVVLWKAAGAHNVATGKFFNLRRFTKSRFDEPSEGGGQLPYWLEEGMLAFLRESDLIRVDRAGLLSRRSQVNPYGARILKQLKDEPGKAWVALSWRQYLWGMADLEQRLSTGVSAPEDVLIDAERTWRSLDDQRILMEEVRNDGTWIRQWRRAVVEM